MQAFQLFSPSRRLRRFRGRLSAFQCFSVALILAGCATMATKDQVAYDKQTSCKADVLQLIDKATTPYDDNKDVINAVVLNVERAYEYDAGRPLNKITIDQWNIIRDPSRNTFAGFVKLWKEKGRLSAVYVTEKKKQIGAAFDQIIQLESGKISK
jgi:hypothetical protein